MRHTPEEGRLGRGQKIYTGHDLLGEAVPWKIPYGLDRQEVDLELLQSLDFVYWACKFMRLQDRRDFCWRTLLLWTLLAF